MSSISVSGLSQREHKPLSSIQLKAVPSARKTKNLVFSTVPVHAHYIIKYTYKVHAPAALLEFKKYRFHIYCATLLQDSELAKRGCKSRNTYNNEQYKIYKIVEGVSVHDVVHDVYPSFQSDDLERKDKWLFYMHVSAQLTTCRHSGHTPVRWKTLPILFFMIISQKRAELWGPSSVCV